MQALLVLVAAGLLMFAGYSLGRAAGYDQALEASEIDPPRRPGAGQVIVLALLGLGALGGALALQVEGGVRLLTPARLSEMQSQVERGPERGERGSDDASQPGPVAERSGPS